MTLTGDSPSPSSDLIGPSLLRSVRISPALAYRGTRAPASTRWRRRNARTEEDLCRKRISVISMPGSGVFDGVNRHGVPGHARRAGGHGIAGISTTSGARAGLRPSTTWLELPSSPQRSCSRCPGAGHLVELLGACQRLRAATAVNTAPYLPLASSPMRSATLLRRALLTPNDD